MISIVVIGRNEANNLLVLFESIGDIQIQKEIIYVDSASIDNSVDIAKKFSDKVVQIDDSEDLSASKGRYLGTQQSSFKWVLYLDGDMILEKEFIMFLNQKKFISFDDNIKGFIGYYQYLYKENEVRDNVLKQNSNTIVDHFGGAVLLHAETVLQAGNWCPLIYANEEIDLYSRIKKLGCYVYGLDLKMVKHHAKKETNLDVLINLYIPRHKRFFGLGQVLLSQYFSNNLVTFMKSYPFPFIFILIFMIFFFNVNIALVLLSLVVIFISIYKRWYYNLIYISDIIRGFSGIIKYYKTFKLWFSK